jgi:hypothetical protein
MTVYRRAAEPRKTESRSRSTEASPAARMILRRFRVSRSLAATLAALAGFREAR